MNLIGIVLITLGIILDILFIYFDDKYHGKSSIVLKTVSSLMFVILAFYLSDDKLDKYIVIALTLNMLGDFILILRNIYPKYHDLIYLFGTLVFLIGHLYLSLYLLKLDFNCFFRGVLINVLMFMLVGVYLIRLIKVKNFIIKIISCLYVFIILFTLGISISHVINEINLSNIFFMIAALIFTISDVLLIIHKFHPKSNKYLQITYRALYYVSQMMFAISLIF